MNKQNSMTAEEHMDRLSTEELRAAAEESMNQTADFPEENVVGRVIATAIMTFTITNALLAEIRDELRGLNAALEDAETGLSLATIIGRHLAGR